MWNLSLVFTHFATGGIAFCASTHFCETLSSDSEVEPIVFGEATSTDTRSMGTRADGLTTGAFSGKLFPETLPRQVNPSKKGYGGDTHALCLGRALPWMHLLLHRTLQSPGTAKKVPSGFVPTTGRSGKKNRRRNSGSNCRANKPKSSGFLFRHLETIAFSKNGPLRLFHHFEKIIFS